MRVIHLQRQAPLLHKLLLLTCSSGGRPHRQQQLARQGPSYLEQRLQKGQARVVAPQSGQAAPNAQLATASRQLSSSWSISALPGLPWLVTLPLSVLGQQQT